MANPNSHLNPHQILQGAYDEAEQRIRVDAAVTATIGTVDVIISADVDNIAIRNSTNTDELLINPDGSINVNTTTTEPSNYNEILNYNEITGIAAASENVILTYTVPLAKIFYLHRVEVSGNNLADYKVKINSNTKTKKKTWWTEFNETFEYITSGNKGLKLSSGDVIDVTVLHNSTMVGSFNASLQGVQIG